MFILIIISHDGEFVRGSYTPTTDDDSLFRAAILNHDPFQTSYGNTRSIPMRLSMVGACIAGYDPFLDE